MLALFDEKFVESRCDSRKQVSKNIHGKEQYLAPIQTPVAGKGFKKFKVCAAVRCSLRSAPNPHRSRKSVETTSLATGLCLERFSRVPWGGRGGHQKGHQKG